MGSQKKITPEPVDPLRPEFHPLSRDIADYARGLVGREATPYTGTGVSPITGGETDILNQIRTMATGGDGISQLPFGQERGNLISDILSGRRLSPDSNPFLGQHIDAIRRHSTDTLGSNMNMLDAAFGGAGMGRGSERARIGTDLARRHAGDVDDRIANILGAQYQQGLGEQMGVLGSVLPGMDQFRSSMLFGALGAEGLPRQIDQQQRGFDYNEFLRQQQEPMNYLQLAMQALGSAPGMQHIMPQYAPAPWQQVLGALSQGAAMAAPMMGG